jgi:alpha-N-arabinofuranosidase
MANLAQTVNVLQALILTEKNKMLLTPTYHVFDLFKVHMDAKYLPIEFASPDYQLGEKKIPALNVSASQDANGIIHISLVNLDPKNKISLATNLESINWKTVTGQILTSAKLTDINTFNEPNKIHLAKFDGAKKSGKLLKLDLPAQSIVVLELK